jgi:hypothetical protein
MSTFVTHPESGRERLSVCVYIKHLRWTNSRNWGQISLVWTGTNVDSACLAVALLLPHLTKQAARFLTESRPLLLTKLKPRMRLHVSSRCYNGSATRRWRCFLDFGYFDLFSSSRITELLQFGILAICFPSHSTVKGNALTR